MAKYSKKYCTEAEEFISKHGLHEYGGAKIKDFCAHLGIDRKTHDNWLKSHKEYKDTVNRAKDKFKSDHTGILFNTLMEAAKGGERTVTDEVTEYRPDPNNPENAIIRKQTRHKKTIYVQPNVVAAIFLLCNLDPEHFKNRQQNDISIRKPDTEEEMTLDEINAEISRLEKLDEKK